MNRNYKDPIENELTFRGKTVLKDVDRVVKKILNLINTKREDTKLLFATDWLQELNWKIEKIKQTTNKTYPSQKKKIIANFKNYMNQPINRTRKNTTANRN